MGDKAKNPLKSKIVMAVVTLLVVFAVLAFVGIDTKNFTSELIKTRSGLEARNKQLSNLTELKEESKIAEPKVTILQGILPERDELFSFPNEIESLAESHGVIGNFTFGSEDADSISYSINAQGTYGAVINFLDAIEKDIQFMSISSVDLVANANGYNATINGSVFFNE